MEAINSVEILSRICLLRLFRTNHFTRFHAYPPINPKNLSFLTHWTLAIIFGEGKKVRDVRHDDTDEFRAYEDLTFNKTTRLA